MIPPYELKNKTFHTVFKGYSKVEVDEYLAFVIEKYTELYRAQDSLTRKLARVEAELEELKEKEDAIRQVLVNSQSAAKKLTAETERRSKLIIESTTETCERILSEFREQIRVEIDTLRVLRTQVLEFKSTIFAEYQKHIELINGITPSDMSDKGFALTPAEYAARALAQARNDTLKPRARTRKEIEEERAIERAVKLTVEDLLKFSPDNGDEPKK